MSDPSPNEGANRRPTITAIVPILEAEPQLRQTLEGLASIRDRVDLEILIVVDVPNPDREGAVRRANDPIAAGADARVLYRLGRRGFGSALRHGFAEAAGDAVVPVMGDGSEDPEAIVRMADALRAGWDVVAGSRYMRGGGIVGDTAKQRLSRWYSALCRALGGPPVHDVSNAFKCYRRPVVDSVPTVADSFDISVELTVKAHRAGFRVTEVPTVWTNRRAGSSKFSIRRELAHYGRWLALAASPRPRRPSRMAAGSPSSGTLA